MADATGLQFVVTTPLHAVDQHDRRLIKGHATKARKRQRRISNVRSWIAPDRELESMKAANGGQATTIPQRAGTDFSGLQLPSGIEPCMIQELMKCKHDSGLTALIDWEMSDGQNAVIDIGKKGTYPCEICLDVSPVERGWFPYMISDACCLHSMMFSVRVLEEKASQLHLNPHACSHYAQTLRLLQDRLYDFDQTYAISDATIMVVITLASVAELMNEHATVENHIRGLEKIVALRGGVRALNTHTNMPVKVCR